MLQLRTQFYGALSFPKKQLFIVYITYTILLFGKAIGRARKKVQEELQELMEGMMNSIKPAEKHQEEREEFLGKVPL